MASHISDLKKHVERAQVVSFDIFDTLLVRTYASPKDVFRHIEETEEVPLFTELRVNAENEARLLSSQEEITLDEIYAEYPANNVQHLLNLELKYEKNCLLYNPEIYSIYKYALELNKKIIAVSDMYLPKDFLQKILINAGYTQIDKIYLSSELKVTKHTGNLFKLVLTDLHLDLAKDLLHIGDNRISDLKKPSELGITAFLYPTLLSQFLQSTKKLYYFNKNTPNSLSKSIILGFFAYKWMLSRYINNTNTNYWYQLGYYIAGPVIYGYTKFIYDAAIKHQLTDLFFIARDGYTLKRVYEECFSSKNIKTHYIYAPRALVKQCFIEYDKKSIESTNSLISRFSSTNKELNRLSKTLTFKNIKENNKFIIKNKSLLYKCAEGVLSSYRTYISNYITNSSSIGIIDTFTAKFSAQRLIETALQQRCHGLYWGAGLKYSKLFKHSCFIENNGPTKDIFTSNWNFMEFLITSPEVPIKNINERGLVEYDPSPSKHELLRANIYYYISEGALQFSKDLCQIYQSNHVKFDGSTLVSLVNSYIHRPNMSDKDHMSKIYFASDSDHKKYYPLFIHYLSKNELKKPIKAINAVKKNKWLTKKQLFCICILKPLTFRKRASSIELYLLPYIPWRIIAINFLILSKFTLSLFIGCKRQ